MVLWDADPHTLLSLIFEQAFSDTTINKTTALHKLLNIVKHSLSGF